MPNDAFNLRVDSPHSEYKVHPVVVFSVLDHYKRRTGGQERVIGTLLGRISSDSPRIVTITNSFPVPHVENDDQVIVDMDYHDSMLSLHKKTCKDEVVVGWYTTSDTLGYTSSLINDVYKDQVNKPVLVTVDVDVRKNHRIGLKGYIGSSVNVGKRMPPLARFEPVDLQITAYEAEKIGVDALINGIPEDERLDAPASILTDFDNLEGSLYKLADMINGISTYVEKVKAGEMQGDPVIGKMIVQALSNIPHLTEENFQEILSGNMQDLLMVIYLSKVTRSQLLLADKINQLL